MPCCVSFFLKIESKGMQTIMKSQEIGCEGTETHAGEQLLPRNYLNTVLRKYHGLAKRGPYPCRLRSSHQHSQGIGKGSKAFCRHQVDKDAGLKSYNFSNYVNKG